MTTFKINDAVSIQCESKKTRNGFCHRATMYINGRKEASTFCSYLNRTWESYDFESVLQKLNQKTNVAKEEFAHKIANGFKEDAEKESKQMFGSIAAVAMMGEIFGSTPKEKNDWKARMLKAGLGDKGLSMPDDWDTLSEEEKETRLNNVINFLKK